MKKKPHRAGYTTKHRALERYSICGTLILFVVEILSGSTVEKKKKYFFFFLFDMQGGLY
jgi:hypothetical protein